MKNRGRTGPKPIEIESQAALIAYIHGRCRREDDCLIWTGVSVRGAPAFNLVCCRQRNPRAVLWLASGHRLRKGKVFAQPDCHALCLTPEHQVYTTRGNQMTRAAKHGRLSVGARHSAKVSIGTRTKRRTVHTIEKVRAMRARYAETGNAAQVGREFGVRHNYAWQIVTNGVWREPSPWQGLA